jgi:PEP-CTERM motif-containing protein
MLYNFFISILNSGVGVSMRVSTVATAVAGAMGALVLNIGAPTAAQAATYVGGCNTGDIIPGAGACYGYFAGNQLGNSGDMQAAQATALAALGLSGPYVQVEHIDLSSSTIDFNTLLNGATYIGVHWGKGKGGPGDCCSGGVTGFYRLDLANNANLDKIWTNFASTNSGAVLFKTQPPCVRGCDNNPGGDVPEPASWAMMIIGFGGVGALMRRRRTGSAFA